VRTPVKLGLYGAGLLVAFGAALGAGRAVGPSEEPAKQKADAAHEATGGDAHEATGGDAHGTPAAADHLPGGLQVTEAGYRLAPDTTSLTPGAATEFRFRVLGPNGEPVTTYTPTHERDLHLIVVRRDLSGFQHVHPTRAADGLWSIPLTVAEAGQYRVFADFQPAGRAEPLTLGIDVPAAGAYQPRKLPTEESSDVDGYHVELHGRLEAGTSSTLTIRITRDGTPVTDLQPYLGALGHLVALRDGDLAYLHVHPNAGPELSFTVEVPSSGTYGLFLDFRHGDTVHTATFTASAS